MTAISTNDPILKVEELQTKFDLGIVSNSLIKLLGSYLEARIVQQLHYWTVQKYGRVIDGLRWIYKPIREWLTEALIGFTSWQLRKAIASLVEKGILFREHLFKKHHGNNFAPKNRTYYYSLNYEGLEEFAREYESAETIENVRFVSDTNQFCESSEKQFCDKTKNKTDITSIENNSKDKSHPHLPCEWEIFEENNQGTQQLGKSKLYSSKELKSKQVNSVNSKAIEQDKSFRRLEEKINSYINTNQDDVRESVEVEVEKPKLKKTPKGNGRQGVEETSTQRPPKPKRKGQAPWKDEGQFKRFYRALIRALPIVANAHSPQGLAQVIIRQLRSGIPHSYWDDFIAGLPIGTSSKPEWEIEPGVPYPMFIEYLTEKIIRGNNTQTQEQARNEVFRILSQPRQAKDFWGQFKRSVVNVSEQVERDRALGVSNPNTPVWTRERIEPSIQEAAEAGDKIMAVNGASQAVLESTKTPQLESKNSPSVSLSKSEGVFSPPDPWSDSPTDTECDEPQLSMREMLAARGVKGFCKPMPKVSQEEAEAEAKAESEAKARQQMNRKTHISQMSVAEINELLADPITRKELMPQLWHSNYELITDEYGEIIGVRQPSSS